MSYNPDFWVAVAAAAPVIGLANVLGFTEFLMAFVGRAPGWMPPDAARLMRQGGGAGYILSFGGILAQTAALIIALLSLEDGSDAVKPIWVIVLTAGGMLVALAHGVLYALIRPYRPEPEGD